MKWITTIYRRLFPGKKILPQIEQATVHVKNYTKALHSLHLSQIKEDTGLSYKSIHTLATLYEMTITELVDYYVYFGQLPSEEYLIIIKHFGLSEMIAQIETEVEFLTEENHEK